MSKKILSVMLALMLVLSSFAVTAFASGSDIEVENDEEVIESTQYWSLSEPTKVSDGVYSVDVSLTTNYVTGAISFRIDSANGATLTDAVINNDVITYNYNRAFNADGVVAIVPEPANDTDEGIEVNGVIATVTFTLAAGTEGDTLTLVNDRKTAENPGGDLVAVRLSDNNLTTGTMIYGQRVINASEEDIADGAVIASVDIGEVAKTPVLTGKHNAIVIDTTKTCNGAYDGVIYGFTGKRFNSANYYNCTSTSSQLAVENGTVVVTAGTGGYGTGTTVALYDLSGNLVATYAIVLFGDVDGNGTFTTNDITVLKNNLSKITAKTPQFMAGNLASNYTRLTTGDITDLKNNLSTLDQAAIGAKHTYSN